MVEIILKEPIERQKIEALVKFLKSMNIAAEVKEGRKKEVKKKVPFSLHAGIWENHDIDADTLRKNAWKIRT